MAGNGRLEGELRHRLERMIADGVADGSLSVDDTPRATAEVLYDLWLGARHDREDPQPPGQLDRAMAVTRRILHV
ncbi:hypothetical protein [Amycolatopsis sp. NPDC051061]|uniref:hypothetical protein n=1 Tax=Amycolatopsis sp. NPDC051061 TaxID=3155042 RepID=UPI00344346B1